MAEENNQEEGKIPNKINFNDSWRDCPTWCWNRGWNSNEWWRRYRPIF